MSSEQPRDAAEDLSAVLRDAACACFEQNWREGRRPRIEDCLDDPRGCDQPTLLRALLVLEVRLRTAAGEAVAPDEYCQRFPLYPDVVAGALAAANPASRNGAAGNGGPPGPIDTATHPAEVVPGGMNTLPETAGRDGERAAEAENDPVPERIGDYPVERLLGQGSFGRVYLARDEVLGRCVAIKVPHRHLVARPEDAEAYFAEARTIAALDHPNIVPVFFVGSTDEFPCFIISKFIGGTTLAERIRQTRLTVVAAAGLVADVADALHYAHLRGIVHRDVKPGNILLDPADRPYVADFGMALREQDFGTGPAFAGTVPYMSPEQARGEAHRVDGRSDVFNLGVVFYELLTGRRPFQAAGSDELLSLIISAEARPPRQVDDRIPAELERVCLKALSKAASHRYTTAKDMAEDLRCFLSAGLPAPPPAAPGSAPTGSAAPASAPPAPPGDAPSPGAAGPETTSRAPQSVRVVPKGLRSFDSGDTDFFLELLPGPRDRDGLPESLRFWKTRVEELAADRAFPVGVLYGPSGCGKSSLVKAGLLPRLAGHVTPLYVEASGDETEARLLKRIHAAFPAVPADRGLAAAVAALRRGAGADRGKKVLLVLDQFEQWLHARRGQANTELVRALRHCDGGRVQCLVLIRDDFWMAATRFLQELEVRLLEGENAAAVDLFDLRHCRKVLGMFGRAFGTLPGRAGLTSEQTRFLDEAVRGLAVDGKVIPVRLALFAEMVKWGEWVPAALKALGGPEGVGEAFLERAFGASTAAPARRLHQREVRAVLAALLPEQGTDIRGGLRSRDDLLAASGYAGRGPEFDELLYILDRELRLVSPSDADGAAPAVGGTTAAPGPYYQLTHDYLVPSIRNWLTRKQRESARGRAELRLAERAELWAGRPENRHLPSAWEWARIEALTARRGRTPPQRRMMRAARWYYASRGVVLATALALVAWGAWDFVTRVEARALQGQLSSAAPGEVPAILKAMDSRRRQLEPSLRQARAEAEAAGDPSRVLRLSLALLPSDPGQAGYLYERLFDAEPQEFVVVRTALIPHSGELLEPLWDGLADRAADPRRRFRAGCALAQYAPDDPRWAAYGGFVVERLAAENPLVLATWRDALRPVGGRLLPSLADLLADGRWEADQRRTLVELYRGFAGDRPDAYAPLDAKLAVAGGRGSTPAEAAKPVANVAAALVALGRGSRVWHLLVHGEDPTVRSYLIERLGSAEIDARTLKERLDVEPDVSARRALILALGEFRPEEVAPLPRAMLARYESDPDAGTHAAAARALRRWGLGERLRAIDATLATGGPVGARRWYVNRQGQTLSIIRGAGRPDGPGDYALGTTEVTVREFRAFKASHRVNTNVAPTPDCPVTKVSWFDAIEYCNWLSKQDGIPEGEWSYVPGGNGKLTAAPGFGRRLGYRLPTVDEWTFACRAGSKTRYGCGDGDQELVSRYAWWYGNSAKSGLSRLSPVASLKPNDWGLFDMHGNASEWCQDAAALGEGPRSQGKAGLTGEYRAVNGGDYFSVFAKVASDDTGGTPAVYRGESVGFRVAKTWR